jgi:acyl carrier protein
MEVRTLTRLISDDDLRGEDELALRDQRVLAPRIVAVPHQTTHGTATCRFDEGSYVVTGGTAGLGLRVAAWLAERGARRLVLNSRKAPSDDARRSIDDLRARGVDVRVVQGDVADDACVAALLESADATQLRGVLHCAGVIDDAALIHQTWRHLENVMHAKVAGAWNLHRMTRDLPLEYFVMFSSAAAFIGSSGQSNYAAANAYLGGLAEYRRALGLPALTIDWGPWAEVGAATRGGVLERARAAGLRGMAPWQGLEILGRLMASDSSHVAALDVDWSLFLDRYPALRGRGPFASVSPLYSGTRTADGRGADAASKGSLVRALEAAAPGSRRAKLFDAVHAEAVQALGMAVGEAIDPQMPLAELGLDSLMAVQLRNALSARLGRQLPATLLFTYPTLELVTEHLAGELGLAASVIEAPAADELESLSEDELAALLERRLGISKAAP